MQYENITLIGSAIINSEYDTPNAFLTETISNIIEALITCILVDNNITNQFCRVGVLIIFQNISNKALRSAEIVASLFPHDAQTMEDRHAS